MTEKPKSWPPFIPKVGGYDGVASQRIVATVWGKRRTLAWGDDIAQWEIQPFIDHHAYVDVVIEEIEDKAAELLAHPQRDESE